MTADGRVVGESVAIVTYLLRTYDAAGKFGGGPDVDWLRDEELTSFGATSLGTPVILNFLLGVVGKKTPFLARPIVGPLTRLIGKNALEPQVRASVQHCEDVFGEGDYFMGRNPGRADFIMSYPMDQVDHCNMVDLKKDFPKVAAWRKRYTSRPAWIRALEKGNGYDWANGMTFDVCALWVLLIVTQQVSEQCQLQNFRIHQEIPSGLQYQSRILCH